MTMKYDLTKNGRMTSKVINSLSYGILERIIDLLFGLTASIITVRYLGREEYGIINYIISIGSLINFINLAPETYLYKVYMELSKDKLNEYLSSYMLFSILKSSIIIILNLVIGIVLYIQFGDIAYLAIILINGLVYLFTSISAIFIVFLELNFNQQIITKIFIAAKLIRTLVICGLIIVPSLYLVVIADLLFALVQIILFFIAFRSKQLMKISANFKESIYILKESIYKYSIWTHFTGVITQIIYKIDPLILGVFSSMMVVGKYSIALNISNYFIIIFQVLQKNTNMALGNLNDNVESSRITLKFTIASVIIAIFQYIGFIFLGKYFLMLYVDNPIEIQLLYEYSLYIILGLSIFNAFRPLASYLTIKSNPKTFLLNTILPSGLMSVIFYIVGAKLYGALGVAIANVVTYSFAVILILCALKKSKFNIRSQESGGEVKNVG
ncbi:oligosaccharide flippase family protein [Bacillus sp. EB106-08-02-XG196]|uniref:lipopolysaccharide biosynthesis protein n=1 Tax=Bacillus sp. EB106-08-02-XG196 TaxID=2737049 RepID=UPI0017E34BD1|nr:oligosaccharide flippase family protein [Bacillus sp. EB106-08-02-XG196]NWQ41101.1 oligosaccharide flippase family protein [Bacillus sp. EB106-08-02-XG196]